MHMDLHRLVEFTSREVLKNLDRISQWHDGLAGRFRQHGFHCFCWFDHS